MSRCGKCGAVWASEIPELAGLCPSCLMTDGLGDGDATVRPAGGFGTGSGLRLFGDYELLGEVARGGMGVIYRARQRSLGRVVAVKVLSSGEFASPEFVRRFEAEAVAAGRLQHPNIVAIHEVGDVDGVRYFSMDYVEGPNLAQHLNGLPQPGRRAAELVATIAEAVHFAHRHGILHRDLKPSNVLIDPFGEPRLTDFGLAKELAGNSDLTRTGQVLGTPGFLAPEQADPSCGPLTPAADIFSLGAILYFLLTARAPFAAGSLQETLRLVLVCEPVAPRLLIPGIPRDLETICLRCLERDPARRYESAEALAADLRHFLAGEAIVARPLSTTERFFRWCRRHPSRAAAWLLLVTLAAGSAVASLWIAAALGRAQTAEARGRERLREARLAEARAVRQTTVPGRRAEALAALTEAARIRPGPDLRDEAIATLLRPDIRVAGEWKLQLSTPSELTFDGTGRKVAVEPRDGTGRVRGAAELRRWGEDRSLGRCAPESGVRAVGTLRFSRDGGRVMARYSDASVRIWNTEPVEPLLRLADRPLPGDAAAHGDANSDYDFSPDGRTFALGRPGGGVTFHALPDGREVTARAADLVPGMLQFSPDGRHLAMGRVGDPAERRVLVLGLPEAASWRTLAIPGTPSGLAWASDGRVLAVATVERLVALYDMPAGRLLGHRVSQGMGGGEMLFTGEDRLLALRGVGTTLRLLAWMPGQEELVIDGVGPGNLGARPSAAEFIGTTMQGVARRWEVLPPVGFRVIPPTRPVVHDMTINGCSFDFSPDGRWVASGHGRFTVLRDLAFGRQVDEADSGRPQGSEFSTVAFCDAGRALLRCSTTVGIERIELPRDERDQPRLGPHRVLDAEPHFYLTDHSADGRLLALVNPSGGEIRVVEADADGVRTRCRIRAAGLYSGALSPDGTRILVNCAGGVSGSPPQQVGLHRVADGGLITNLTTDVSCDTAWSADGGVVLTSNGQEVSRCWDTSTWTTRCEFRGGVGGNVTTFALAPDGTYAVVAHDEQVSLVSTRDAAVRARLECPGASGLATGIRFLPDGRRFGVLWRDGRIDVIAPEELRRELAAHGLGW